VAFVLGKVNYVDVGFAVVGNADHEHEGCMVSVPSGLI
jgi:hypothetical protein